MWIYIVLSVVYILLAGLATIKGTWDKAGLGEKPLVYCSVTFQFILNVGFILWLIMSLGLFFFNWKYALGAFASFVVLGRLLYYPIAENIIIMPLAKYLMKKGQEMDN